MTNNTLTRNEIVALDKQLIWHPYTPMRPYIDDIDPVVVDRAEGIYFYDRDGTRLIDANSSWWVNVLGHNHPRLMAALVRQTEKLAHCCLANITHEPAVRVAQKLLERCGSDYARVFYSDNGTTAVECGLRMAYQYWQNVGQPKKKRFVSLSHAFHGETIGSASVSGTKVFHQTLGPLLFDCIQLPSPGKKDGTGSDRPWYEQAFARARDLLQEQSQEIAAIILEPLVQGAAGMLMYPPEYLSQLHQLCQELDILLIADEVFVGYGRTGTFFAHQQANIEPDIICMAKGFSGGVLPMAATVANKRVFEAFLGPAEQTLWYGHSFTGNPLGAAVALETLTIFEEEKIIESLPPKCNAIQRGLDRLTDHPWVHDVRRTGMIAAFTLVSDTSKDATANYLDDAGWRFSAEARKRGAWLRPLGNVVYFVVPLTITEAQIDELFDIAHQSLQAIR